MHVRRLFIIFVIDTCGGGNFIEGLDSSFLSEVEQIKRFIMMFLLSHDMQFGLQHPNFSFDYNGHDTSQMVDSLKNLVAKVENAGFDSFG